MGAFLDKPAVEKENHSGSCDRLSYALAAMQGWRTEMEVGLEFVNILTSTPTFKEGDKTPEHLSKSLRQAHFAMDEYLKEKFPSLLTGEDRSGTTAVSAFVTPTHIIIANCGDSRAVLCSDGGVKFGSNDHKPTNDEETKRITAAEGQVVLGRVNGNLAVSRALGDFVYKDVDALPAEKQKVSPEPDMTTFERSEKDEFLVLACDGIWDVMSNEAAYTFVCNQFKAGYTPTETCNRLLDYCLSLGSKDNMSAVVVKFAAAPEKVEGFKAPEEIPDPNQGADRESPTPQGHVVGIETILSAIMQGGATVSSSPGEDGEGDGPVVEQVTDGDDSTEDSKGDNDNNDTSNGDSDEQSRADTSASAEHKGASEATDGSDKNES
ncbi:hypothetical protein PTSG_09303 [Salpingoeca rosetta]|uniref:PPM-type phosphatase domain-containing protein n=1 Tax=Salpingoeca rosetta (strain ATCC 50818 / BSB-021) TaxID=946362 RepID=F2UM88_SALR5|nr:uncharacterized protein PTSG_09303 [Salpingoeca rosetta]EGD78237.1 hypothetical protein PTSG_09303 [Salpingoeca rosetta]|eukprot:XP_004989560.1 hypothetical protein PTSG_09303 [Salpingoeca rosetta]